MQDLNVCLVQSDILWEQRDENLKAYSEKLSQLQTAPDLIVLPEMFATGFTMNAACAEEELGAILGWMQQMAQQHQCVITGSAMIKDHSAFYNRLFWVQADGQYSTYDKRHLFRFGREQEYYEPGNKKVIFALNGWKFRPLVCYDLRFPVWARNTYINGAFEYDCLLYVANWPERRAHHWKSLLIARAIENLSYCIGVNRIGKDGNGISHAGNSMICDPLGAVVQQLDDHQQGLISTTLESKTLLDWRTKFNVGQDWDRFEILP